MNDKLLIPNYYGRSTSCHVQALKMAYPSIFSELTTELLDALTTVPFGVMYRPADPNRLLDCWLDPDIGLDQAFQILQLPFESIWWEREVDFVEPFEVLKDWCRTGPVILGPVDMGRLPYFFHSELFSGIDHYIVVTGINSHYIWVSDPETVPLAILTPQELEPAWRAVKVPEGRGAYTMRRVCSQKLARCTEDTLRSAFRFAAQNLAAARSDPFGGGSGHAGLARDEKLVLKNASLRQGLSFVLPTRSQRCMVGRQLVGMLSQFEPEMKQSLRHCSEIFEDQARLYADVLVASMELRREFFDMINTIGSLEDELTDLFVTISGQI